MKKIKYPIAIVTILLLSAFVIKSSDTWNISKDYSIKYDTKFASGEFSSFKGTIVFDEKDLNASNFNITIDVSSIKTGLSLKNRHARSDRWFDAKKYPEIKFKSSEFRKTKSGYEVKGILDMHDTQKQISIPFTFENNIFVGSFEVDRLDYEVGNLEGMGYTVGTIVNIDISVPVYK